MAVAVAARERGRRDSRRAMDAGHWTRRRCSAPPPAPMLNVASRLRKFGEFPMDADANARA
eukprot:CAMPEP_0176100686 /NCGR_PEP_ID=MMETSP0120_2-20121206/50498_1 /TAXON_ID=160619 /ORGANISM="Kryptoperidinium foliaceum, Strain CCMP 1326" /LENGTH=60 /DNA_ID=CAMNT_0017434729 /DNA_START=57 /DNA_END=236 /DNA_ORIENTATION=+